MKELKDLKYLVLKHNEIVVFKAPDGITIEQAQRIGKLLNESPVKDRFIFVAPDFKVSKRKKK